MINLKDFLFNLSKQEFKNTLLDVLRSEKVMILKLDHFDRVSNKENFYGTE